MANYYLSFSDSAKFAEAARELLAGNGFIIHHSFFDAAKITNFSGQGWEAVFLPLNSLFLVPVFRLFSVSDTSVLLTGLVFLLITAFLVYLLARKLHSCQAGIYSVILLLSLLPMWEYAFNFSTEILFSFEIVLFAYFYLQTGNKRLLAVLPLGLMFLTRQHAIVFLAATLTAILFEHRFNIQKVALVTFVLFAVFLAGMIDLSSQYSPLKALYSVQLSLGVNQGDYLRGRFFGEGFDAVELGKKIFYNVYNFAKSPERIAPVLLIGLYIIGIVVKKTRLTKLSVILLLLFILAAAASLPNARYIHPLVPLFAVIASIGLLSIKSRFAQLVLLALIVLPTVGHATLDARFRKDSLNVSKPPATKIVADYLNELTPGGGLVITNLDAWAAWYHGRSTMWFPLSPRDLEKVPDNANVRYLFITNYKEHDGDFRLGEWAEVVYTPESIKNSFLRENYQVIDTFRIDKGQIYENIDIRGTVLERVD